MALAETGKRVEPARARQKDVKQDEVEVLVLVRCRYGIGASAGLQHFDAGVELLQNHPHSFANQRVVIDYENLHIACPRV
jgi:hypothetical protein